MAEKYTIQTFQIPEVLAGKQSVAKYIRIKRGEIFVGQIKYEMVGGTVKVWNRNVGTDSDQRKIENQLFSNNSFNQDKRTVGEELLIQAITREKALGIETPRGTASSLKAMKRTGKKFGIYFGRMVPKGLKPVIGIKPLRRRGR